MELMNKLWAAAKADKRRIVLPEGDEERTIVATEKIQKEGLAFPILIGDEEKILGCYPQLLRLCHRRPAADPALQR